MECSRVNKKRKKKFLKSPLHDVGPGVCALPSGHALDFIVPQQAPVPIVCVFFKIWQRFR